MKGHFRDEQQSVTHTQSQEAIFWKNGIGICKVGHFIIWSTPTQPVCEMGIESYTIPPVPGIINKQAARKHFYRF